MIIGERDAFIGFHVTPETKQALKEEAKRRKKPLSLMLSETLERWLETAPTEEITIERSNKRVIRLPGEVPLPFSENS